MVSKEEIWIERFRAFDYFCRRHALLLVIFVTLFGGGIRVIHYLRDPLIGRDAAYYVQTADSWQRLGKLEKIHFFNSAPLLLWCMKSGGYLGLSSSLAGISVNILCGTLLIPAAWLLLRIFCGPGFWALAGAILVAVEPRLVALSIEIQRESLYLFFGTVAFAALLAGRKYTSWGGRLAFVGGFFSIFALYSRYEGWEFLLFAAIMAWVDKSDAERLWSRRNLRYAAGVLTGMAAAVVSLQLMGIAVFYMTGGIFDRIWYYFGRI